MLRYLLYQKNLNLNENKKQMNTQKNPNKGKQPKQTNQTQDVLFLIPLKVSHY